MTAVTLQAQRYIRVGHQFKACRHHDHFICQVLMYVGAKLSPVGISVCDDAAYQQGCLANKTSLITDHSPGKSSLVMVTTVRVYGKRNTPGDAVRRILNVSLSSWNMSSMKGSEMFLASCPVSKKTSSDAPRERSMSLPTAGENKNYHLLTSMLNYQHMCISIHNTQRM